MHWEVPLGNLLQMLADLVAVHGTTGALQEPQDDQGACPGIELFLELFVGCPSVHFFWLIPAQTSADCSVLIT